MKKTIFTGAGVAIITPMNEDLSINWPELGRLIDDQVANGTDAIVIVGTTGEASTLTDDEHVEAIRFAVEHTGSQRKPNRPAQTRCCMSPPITTRLHRRASSVIFAQWRTPPTCRSSSITSRAAPV